MKNSNNQLIPPKQGELVTQEERDLFEQTRSSILDRHIPRRYAAHNLCGNRAAVFSACLCQKGKLLVVADISAVIYIYDYDKMSLLGVIDRNNGGLNYRIHSIAMSLDGRTLFTAESDYKIRVWDIQTRRLIRQVSNSGMAPQNRDDPMQSFCIKLALNRQNLVSCHGYQIFILDVKTGKTVRRLESSEIAGHYTSIALSQKNDVLVGAFSRHLAFWNIRSGELINVLDTDGEIQSVAFSPDGRTVASRSFDEKFQVWGLENGSKRTFKGPHSIGGICFSPDGQIVISEIRGGIHVYSPHNGGVIKSIYEQSSLTRLVDSDQRYFCFDPDGYAVSIGWEDQAIRVIDLKNGRRLKIFKPHTSCVHTVHLSQDGTKLAYAGSDSVIRVLDLKNGQLLKKLEGHSGDVNAITMNSDGTLLVSGGDDHSVRLWDLKSNKCRVLEGHIGEIHSLIFNQSERFLVSAGGHSIRFWNVTDGRCFQELKDDWVWPDFYSIHFGDNEEKLYCRANFFIWVYDVKSRKLLKTGNWEPNEDIYSYNLDRHGDYLVCGSSYYNGKIGVWSIREWRWIKKFKVHAAPVIAVVFSQDGKNIISGGMDNAINITSLESGEVIKELRGHTGPVNSVLHSHCGRFVVSASSDHTVRFWDYASGELRAILHNLEDGFLWSTPPEPGAPSGWVWTDQHNRQEVVHVIENDINGAEARPVEDESKRISYIKSINSQRKVMTRINDIGRYKMELLNHIQIRESLEVAQGKRHRVPLLTQEKK